MEKLLKRASGGDWEKLAIVFFKRFCSNNDSDFIGEAAGKEDNYLMYKLFVEHKKTQTFIKDFKERFEKYIKKYDYDIVSFSLYDFHQSVYGDGEEPTGISRPKFGNFSWAAIKKDFNNVFEIFDAKGGPAICFHDIQGFNVEAKEIQIKNGKFTCKLVFDFYDHFGLDLKDIENHGDSGFPDWYILQHLKEEGVQTGCKAFVNHIKQEEPLELEIEN